MTVSAAMATAGNVGPIVVNELLTYVNFYRNASPFDNLHKVVVGFFYATEISEAKRLLISEFSEKLADCPPKVTRRHSASRPVPDAETEDIIRIFDFIDDQKVLHTMCYILFDLLLLHSTACRRTGPEEVNICTVVDRQTRMGNTVAEIASRLKATNDIMPGVATSNSL